MRFRKARHRRLQERPEQVAEGGKREARLDFGRPGRHDLEVPSPGGSDARAPERGLSDSGLARQEMQPRFAAADRVEEPVDLVEFCLTAKN